LNFQLLEQIQELISLRQVDSKRIRLIGAKGIRIGRHELLGLSATIVPHAKGDEVEGAHADANE